MKPAALLPLLCLLTPAAFAAPLKVEVVTASPEGFLATSTLVSGEQDAVLIDAQFTLADAHRVVAKVLESKKTLKTIFITHAHPDHYFGLEVLKATFPGVEVLTTAAVQKEMKDIQAAKVAYWKPIYTTNLTSEPVLPKVTTADHLELEGERLELVAMAAGESEAATVVWIPSIRTAIVGDLAYNNVHVWLAEADDARRDAWLANLAKVKALGPLVVVAGHEVPDARRTAAVLDDTAAYIKDFEAALAAAKTTEDLEKKMLKKHPKRHLPVILSIAAKAALPGPKT